MTDRTAGDVEADLAKARAEYNTGTPGSFERCVALQAELDALSAPPDPCGVAPQSGKSPKPAAAPASPPPGPPQSGKSATNVVAVSSEPVKVDPMPVAPVRKRPAKR